MNRFCYLLDEDTPHTIRDQLLRREPAMEILAVGDEAASALGTSDAELLRWIEREGFILNSLGQVLEDLIFIWEAGNPEEYRDRVEYLPL